MIGRQRLRIVRCWFTVIVLPLVAAGLSVGSMGRPWGALSLAGGTVVGIALGLYGLRVTKYERTSDGFYYTPSAHLGIGLSLLFAGRVVYRVIQIATVLDAGTPAPPAFGRSPLTTLLFAILAGYYATFSLGLLRWRRQELPLPPPAPGAVLEEPPPTEVV